MSEDFIPYFSPYFAVSIVIDDPNLYDPEACCGVCSNLHQFEGITLKPKSVERDKKGAVCIMAVGRRSMFTNPDLAAKIQGAGEKKEIQQTIAEAFGGRAAVTIFRPKAEKSHEAAKVSKIENDFAGDWHLSAKDFAIEEPEKPEKPKGPTSEPKAVGFDIESIVSECDNIRDELRSVVFGQDKPIDVFVSGIQKALLTDLERRLPPAAGSKKEELQPLGVFMFCGPSGVGKTYLSKSAARKLEDYGFSYHMFDMSGYSDKESSNYLIGFSREYKMAKMGVLTEHVKNHPRSVLVFDEIEKAHTSVKQLFLQVLEEGRLFDNFSEDFVSFSDTILIFTTNAGKSAYEDVDTNELSSLPTRIVTQAIGKEQAPDGSQMIPPALLSRLAASTVVMFNRLDAHGLLRLIREECEKTAKEYERVSGFTVEFGDNIAPALLFGAGGLADARTVRGNARRFVDEGVTRVLRESQQEGKRLVAIEQAKGRKNPRNPLPPVKRIRFCPDLHHCDEKVAALFSPKLEVRMFCVCPQQTFEAISKALGKNKSRSEVSFELVRCDEDSLVFPKGSKMPDVPAYCAAANGCDAAIIDMAYWKSEPGTSSSVGYNNILNVETLGRHAFEYLHAKHPKMPLLVLSRPLRNWNALDDADRRSLETAGAAGFVDCNEDTFADDVATAIQNAMQEEHIFSLTRTGKILNYHVLIRRRSPGDDGKVEVRLAEWSLEDAVDPEDSDNVMSGLSVPDDSFADVIGNELAKTELKDASAYLKNTWELARSEVHPPRGIMLYGHPGTGKTMLARAMAHEADATFISTEGNVLLAGGAGAVHKVFARAKRYAPTVLFIDEFDSIVQPRSTLNVDGQAVVNALLTEMDGFKKDAGRPVLVLTATNTPPDMLDAAAMRRFDVKVETKLPNDDERLRLIEMQIEKLEVFGGITDAGKSYLVRMTRGMSQAEITDLMHHAARKAHAAGDNQVDDDEIRELYEQKTFGERNEANPASDDVRHLAVIWHECGHALVGYVEGNDPSAITTVSRGQFGGLTVYDDVACQTKQETLAYVRQALAGRAAEMVFYERNKASDPDAGVNVGAAADLKDATDVLRKAICNFGLFEDFGMVVRSDAERNGAAVSDYINGILKEQLDAAILIIRQNLPAMEELVGALKERDFLSGEDIKGILQRQGVKRAEK